MRRQVMVRISNLKVVASPRRLAAKGRTSMIVRLAAGEDVF